LKAQIYLETREGQKRKNGYPVVVDLHHNNKRLFFTLKLYFEKADWDFKNQLPKKDKTLFVIVKKKKLLLENILLDIMAGEKYSLEKVKNLLIGENKKTAASSFLDFFLEFIKEKEAAKNIATAKSYQNARNQLKIFRSKLLFSDIDYTLLNDFKQWQFKEGNSKSTIHTYLRKYRTVYNEACRRKLTIDIKPFDSVFNGITVKANRTKKRNITKQDIYKLEAVSGVSMYHQRAVDLWLLLFYFGGQDLKDVYYLEHAQIKKNRVYFMRGKLAGAGYQFDLQITEKAQKIIDKYKVSGKYVFPWRKDFDGYKNFRDNLRRSLDLVQIAQKINVLPLGGFIRIKVARHTFATIGKQLFIDADLLRELMGHERNDVDTIYKDKFPEKVRDEAHLKILSWFICVE